MALEDCVSAGIDEFCVDCVGVHDPDVVSLFFIVLLLLMLVGVVLVVVVEVVSFLNFTRGDAYRIVRSDDNSRLIDDTGTCEVEDENVVVVGDATNRSDG